MNAWKFAAVAIITLTLAGVSAGAMGYFVFAPLIENSGETMSWVWTFAPVPFAALYSSVLVLALLKLAEPPTEQK